MSFVTNVGTSSSNPSDLFRNTLNTITAKFPEEFQEDKKKKILRCFFQLRKNFQRFDSKKIDVKKMVDKLGVSQSERQDVIRYYNQINTSFNHILHGEFLKKTLEIALQQTRSTPRLFSSMIYAIFNFAINLESKDKYFHVQDFKITNYNAYLPMMPSNKPIRSLIELFEYFKENKLTVSSNKKLLLKKIQCNFSSLLVHQNRSNTTKDLNVQTAKNKTNKFRRSAPLSAPNRQDLLNETKQHEDTNTHFESNTVPFDDELHGEHLRNILEIIQINFSFEIFIVDLTYLLNQTINAANHEKRHNIKNLLSLDIKKYLPVHCQNIGITDLFEYYDYLKIHFTSQRLANNSQHFTNAPHEPSEITNFDGDSDFFSMVEEAVGLKRSRNNEETHTMNSNKRFKKNDLEWEDNFELPADVIEILGREDVNDEFNNERINDLQKNE